MAQGGYDEGLGAEIADGDRGVVGFGEGAFGVGMEDFLREESGPLDSEEGGLEFVRVGGHGWRRGGEVEVVKSGNEVRGESKLFEEGGERLVGVEETSQRQYEGKQQGE